MFKATDMRRMGITKNADGTYSTSICRAKIGNEGKFGCHHFAHRDNANSSKQLIVFLEAHKEEFKNTDVNNDSMSISESYKAWLVDNKNMDQDKLDSTDNVLEWFDGDVDKMRETMSEMTESNFTVLKANADIVNDVSRIADDGVKIEVIADRTIGLKESYDSDSSIWKKANGIKDEHLDGEAPVTILVGESQGELKSSDTIRRTYEHPKIKMSIDEAKEFSKLGYASIR